MSQTPAVSVVMSVRNVERYVGEAVQSVLAQTFTDFELLIIDDGSKDGTGKVLKEYARRDTRIRILKGPERGLSAALNLGVAQAQAPLLARMDGDDVCLPTRFEKQVEYMGRHPECVLVGCRCELIDPEGRLIHEKPDTELDHDRIEQLLLRMRWPIVHPAAVMRADAVAKAGGYPEQYLTVEDHDLFLKLGEIGRLANVDEVLLRYRQHFKSTIYTTAESQVKNLVEIVTAACARRGIEPPDEVKLRPIEVVSEAQHRRNWAWKALAAGNVATARHHAWGALRATPWSPESWRATICALRGR